MKVICAWCDKFMYENDAEPKYLSDVSHGICPVCKERMRQEIAEGTRQETRLMPTAQLLRPLGD